MRVGETATAVELVLELGCSDRLWLTAWQGGLRVIGIDNQSASVKLHRAGLSSLCRLSWPCWITRNRPKRDSIRATKEPLGARVRLNRRVGASRVVGVRNRVVISQYG